MKIKIICPCGTPRYVTESNIRRGRGKYCSRKCLYFYWKPFNVSQLSVLNKGKTTHWNRKANAKYAALHLRVQQVRGKAFQCEECASTYWVDWANISGKYDNLYDYKELCRKCHNKFDNIANKGVITKRKQHTLSIIASKGWETRRRNALVSEGVMPR